MKEAFKTIVIGILMVALMLGTVAMAEIDLSGMSYEELVELKDRINKAMWECEEWQEVTVPQGLYKVGEDIPEGHWTIKAYDGVYTNIVMGDVLNANGKTISWEDSERYYSDIVTSSTYEYYTEGDDKTSSEFELIDGDYILINSGDAVFTPYSGKPSLGFK